MTQERREGWDGRQALAVAGLMALCCLVALPLYAETPSKGPDAWTAMWSSGELDLRDERNRPVSRAAIRRGLRRGEAESAREAARLSRLKSLEALLDYLERMDFLAAGLKDSRPDRGVRVAAAAPGRPPKARPPAERPLWRVPRAPEPRPFSDQAVHPLSPDSPGILQLLL